MTRMAGQPGHLHLGSDFGSTGTRVMIKCEALCLGISLIVSRVIETLTHLSNLAQGAVFDLMHFAFAIEHC